MTATWPKARLGEVLCRSAEAVELRPDAEYREVTVRLWGKGVVERDRVTGSEVSGSRRFVARAGHLILSRIDARNGALGIVPPELDGAVVTNDFPLFELNADRLSSSFLGWLCRTQGFVEMCQRASEGTTNRVRLKEDRFLALEIPLPPLAEQRRIVARIETLAALIDDARALRQQAAAETSALMTAARRTAFSECLGEWVALEDTCEAIIDNLHSNPRLSVVGTPCIRSSDVGYGTLSLDTAQRTDDDEYRRRTARGEPRAGDIVLVREGGGTGKCAAVQPSQRFSLGQRVMLLRPDARRILAEYLLHQLLSPQVQKDQIEPLSKGSASPHLNIAALRRFSLVLPALREQHRIVAKLDALQAAVDTARQLQAEAAAELDALLPSVLDRAFRGEL